MGGLIRRLVVDSDELVDGLDKAVAPVADEIDLTLLDEKRSLTGMVLRCVWEVRVKSVDMRPFRLIYDDSRAAEDGEWFLESDDESVTLTWWAEYGDWQSQPIREFLRRQLWPSKSAVVLIVWNGDYELFENALVQFKDPAVIREMYNLTKALRPVGQGKVAGLSVYSTCAKLTADSVTAYQTHATHDTTPGRSLGDEVLLEPLVAAPLFGEEIDDLMLEVSDDGMLLIRSDRLNGWGSIDLGDLVLALDTESACGLGSAMRTRRNDGSVS